MRLRLDRAERFGKYCQRTLLGFLLPTPQEVDLGAGGAVTLQPSASQPKTVSSRPVSTMLSAVDKAVCLRFGR